MDSAAINRHMVSFTTTSRAAHSHQEHQPPPTQQLTSLQTQPHVPPPISSEAQTALNLHNSARARKFLPPLEWDHELTAHAYIWARHLADKVGRMEHSIVGSSSGGSTCNGNGGEGETGPLRPRNQGENLAWAWVSHGLVEEPMIEATRGWLSEEADYHGEMIGQGDVKKYGHYTQCMWSNTKRIGIAFARDTKGGVYTVARYLPSGNWIGQKPY